MLIYTRLPFYQYWGWIQKYYRVKVTGITHLRPQKRHSYKLSCVNLNKQDGCSVMPREMLNMNQNDNGTVLQSLWHGMNDYLLGIPDTSLRGLSTRMALRVRRSMSISSLKGSCVTNLWKQLLPITTTNCY